jgi:hypothetical protein
MVIIPDYFKYIELHIEKGTLDKHVLKKPAKYAVRPFVDNAAWFKDRGHWLHKR